VPDSTQALSGFLLGLQIEEECPGFQAFLILTTPGHQAGLGTGSSSQMGCLPISTITDLGWFLPVLSQALLRTATG
jgi:hypothetical protein